MEGVIYSDTTADKTIDYIELLLDECRNIWIWVTEEIYKEINPETTENVWERHVHIYHNPNIVSIGDCLRELYTRDESRDNLMIIGDTNIVLPKLSFHKNLNKKCIGILLFGQGNMSIDIKGGIINKYETVESSQMQKGRVLEIGFFTPHILALFQDNFDCNTFHELILAKPVGYSFGAVMDKRYSFKSNIEERQEILNQKGDKPDDFKEELKEMCEEISKIDENTKLELNSLRLAHGLTFSKLLESLQELNRNDIVEYLTIKNI